MKQSQDSEMKQHKFQQSVSPNIYDQLILLAKEHGCTSVQELIRSVVIPDWLKGKGGGRAS